MEQDAILFHGFQRQRTMKTYIAMILWAVLAAGCSNKLSPGATDTQSAASTQPTQSKAASSESAAPQTTTVAPVEFTYLGTTPDKENIAYRIKVYTTRPIEEVHLALKEWDASGNTLADTTLIWQNIVKSTRQPIENGKSYEAHSALDPGATRAECSLKEVIFKDGARWSAR
jgi:hypothetical protein